MNIAVLIVSWNVRDLLARCLASVQQEGAAWRDGRVETWVVDNASADGSADVVRQQFPGVHLIETGRNAGFGGGCNAGLAQLPADIDAVFLLNPDAVVAPGTLQALADTLSAHPAVGVVGPLLLEADGTVQSSRRRFPRLLTAFVESTIVQAYLPRTPELARFYVWDRPDTQEQAVDWMMGAALLLRMTAVRQVGGFDEDFFMYFEETDWCRRAADAGWAARFQPAGRVTHLGGRSSAQNLAGRHIQFTQSKVHYYRKHFGMAAAAAVKAFLVLSYLLQILEDAAKLALGHKVAMRRQRIGMLGTVLRAAIAP